MSLTHEPISLERMVSAVERVKERLLRATAALENAGVGYAVAGGNAVAAWVTVGLTPGGSIAIRPRWGGVFRS